MYAKKSLGQNFLSDGNYIRKIIQAVSPSSNHDILEIGPGRGAITSELVGRCRHLWCVEKDQPLADLLKEKYLGDSKIKIIEGDFLKIDFEEIFKLGEKNIRVAGNLPYNVGAPILIKLLKNGKYFSELFLMFQKEVAKRIVAKPSTKDYSLLTVWSEIYADRKILFDLPPTVFKPVPKVTSSFVHFKLRNEPLIESKYADDFFIWIARLFQQRRKTILSVLKGMQDINLEKVKKILPAQVRAEALSVQELVSLFKQVIVF